MTQRFDLRVVRMLTASDFAIRVPPGGRPAFAGMIAAAKQGALEEFFVRDLQPARTLWILGRWDRRTGRALRLRFAGALDPFRRQRVRNFMLHLLR
jgi:hypothetical protein